MTQFADVLIACGQGVYSGGAYPSEYPDADVYLEHAMTTRDVVRQFKYTHVVLSGGLTQKRLPDLSEAEGMLRIMEELGAVPETTTAPMLEAASLDSPENILFSLMLGRMCLGSLPIRRIGVHVAWSFKKPRFNQIARALDLHPYFYFHGLASHLRADAADRALKGEQDFLRTIKDTADPLLLSKQMEEKRRSRYAGKDYAERFAPYRERFPGVVAALDDLRADIVDPRLRSVLVETFRETVLLAS